MGDNKKDDAKAGCCGCLALVIVNCTVGGVCFHYCLQELLARNIPWYGDALCGLVAGEVAIPTAIVLWILSSFGVHVR